MGALQLSADWTWPSTSPNLQIDDDMKSSTIII